MIPLSARRLLGYSLVLCLPVVLGCGSKEAKLAEVQGTVRMKGKPLPNVQVEFLPEASGHRSSAITDEQGNYQLVYADRRPGAQVGFHRVVLSDLRIYEGQAGKDGKEEVAPKLKAARIASDFANVTTTPLRYEIHSGPNTIDLEVTGP